MPDLEKAVCECERIAADDRYYYSQPDRMTTYGRDCSSLVGRALVLAGFDYPADWSPSTREMKTYLERIGWVWHGGIAGVHRGCILWKTGHTAMATSTADLAEALMSETHGIDGAAGDQTGFEIRIAPISYTSWAGYWEYPEEEVTNEDMERIAQMAADKVVNYELNGVLLRDRIIGTDNAANGANNKLADTSDPTGRDMNLTTHDHVKWLAKNQQDVINAIKALQDSVDALGVMLSK